MIIYINTSLKIWCFLIILLKESVYSAVRKKTQSESIEIFSVDVLQQMFF